MAKDKKAVIYTNVDPEVKVAFKYWWRAHNYTTESEAVRALVRDKIEEQEQQEKEVKK